MALMKAAGVPPVTIHQRFERQAATTPDAVAVVFEGASLSYRDLNRRANRVARRLRWLGVEPDALVGLCVERSFDTVVGILGVLKAGGAYVPLDPAYPLERRRFIVQDTAAAVVLTSRALQDSVRSGSGTVVVLDDLWTDGEDAGDDENPASNTTPDHLAYVMHTSGSTGAPKGVLITHANVVRLFDATAPWFRFGPEDVWTLFHSYAFDFSVWEMWGALFHGGKLVVVPYPISRSPNAFHELLVHERVTVLNQTPSAFRQLMCADETAPPSGELALRYVVFGGEALDLASLRPWVERHGAERPALINMYGITETTVHVTYRRLDSHDIFGGKGSVIGVPIPDLRLYVLDERLRPMSLGAVGELFVGGAGLARGYLNRPELTAERFVADPFSSDRTGRLYRTGDLVRVLEDGDLEYVGRADDQVQIRGFRVEPGEVEAALAEHPDVRHAVVVARGGDFRATAAELVAYVVAAPARPAAPGALRGFLSARLPEYMIPSRFVNLDVLPLTASGKVDRRALPDPPAERPDLDQAFVAPRDELERFLARLWCDVLGLDCVGVHDRFFELGGTSIKAAQLISRMQAELGEFVYVVALFDAPSVAEFAALLRRDYAAALRRRFASEGGGVPAPAAPGASTITTDDIRRLEACIPSFAGGAGANGRRNPPAMFVLAPPRSGTTLLRVMLAGHSRLFAAPELQLLPFGTLGQRRAAFTGRFSLWLEGTIRALMELRCCDAEAAKALMQEYEDRDCSTHDFYRVLQDWVAPRILVDKTPQYVLDRACLERAERVFDGALYVHLVRHPGAMVRSFERFHVHQVLFLKEHGFAARQLGELVWLLAHRNAAEFLRGIPAERQFRLRFEDLVSSPRGAMEALCGRFGLPFEEEMIEPYRNLDRKMTDGIYPQSTPMGDTEFLARDRIDPAAARSALGGEPQGGLSELTWELAAAFGYERSATQGPVARMGRAADRVATRRSRLEQRRRRSKMGRDDAA